MGGRKIGGKKRAKRTFRAACAKGKSSTVWQNLRKKKHMRSERRRTDQEANLGNTQSP